MKNKTALFFITLFALAGCVSDPALEAFDGDYDTLKETKVIVTYCQSCHNHSTFDPVSHLAIQPSDYTNAPYNTASDCKTCHQLRKNFWNDYERTTRFPDGSLTNE